MRRWLLDHHQPWTGIQIRRQSEDFDLDVELQTWTGRVTSNLGVLGDIDRILESRVADHPYAQCSEPTDTIPETNTFASLDNLFEVGNRNCGSSDTDLDNKQNSEGESNLPGLPSLEESKCLS